jgi:oligoendopeptidase F
MWVERESLAFRQKYQGKIAKLDGAALGEAIAEYESLSRAAAGLRLGEAPHTAFFRQEISRMKEGDLLDKIAAPALGRYGPWLRRVRAFRDHKLDAAAEEYAQLKKETAEDAWLRLFDLSAADLLLSAGGREMTAPEALALLRREKDPALRRETFAGLVRALEEQGRIVALTLNTLADLKTADDRRRGFDKAEDSRNIAMETEPAAVDALARAVRESYPLLSHRYYAWKAAKTGVARLHPADLRVSLPHGGDSVPPALEAQKTIAETFSKFSPAFAAAAELPPDGASGSILEAARQGGISAHAQLAKNQGPLLSEAPAVFSEATGLFARLLVFRALADAESDLLARRALIAAEVESILDNAVTPVAVFSFERRFHDERRGRGEVAPERIAALWQEEQKAALGSSVNLDTAGASALWMAEPGIVHAPFSSASRAFSQCLALALYDRYAQAADKSAFAARYLNALQAGGTGSLDTLLLSFGIDTSAPQFWQPGLAAAGRLVDELAELDLKISAVLQSRKDFRDTAKDLTGKDSGAPPPPVNDNTGDPAGGKIPLRKGPGEAP